MLKIEYEILQKIEEIEPCLWVDAINTTKASNPQLTPTRIDEILEGLLDAKFIEKLSVSPPFQIKTSSRAHRAMMLFQQSVDEKAERERQRKQDRIHDLCVALASAGVGAILTWFGQFIA